MKTAFLGILILLGICALGGVGIAHVIKPDWFVKRSGVRKGGTMLAEWNRSQIQIFGAILTAAAVFLLYSLFKH